MEQTSFKVSFLNVDIPAFYITEKKEALLALKSLSNCDSLIGIDTETAALPEYRTAYKPALSPHTSNIRLLQIYTGKSVVVFDLHKIKDNSIFINFLESKRFIAHNALFEIKFLKAMGVKNINIGCTLILSKILFHATYPTDEGLSASLANMVEKMLKVEVGKEAQVTDWSIPDLTFEQIQYAALDAVYVLKLAQKLNPALEKLGLQKTYSLLKKAQHPIAFLELSGIKLDTDKHRLAINVWRDKLYASRKEVLELTKLDKLTGHTMSQWLVDNLDPKVLSIWPVTETGKLSTDSHTFSDFSYLPVVKPFSEFQKREKLSSSFGMNLINMINPKTNRVHSSFNLCGARTGRLSCSRPNSQQYPRTPNKEKYPDEPDIRENFIPEEGNVFICADYSQIELRVAAELSRDKVMLKAYEEGIDLHSLTASKVSGKRIEDVTKEERQQAKALMFGLIFGLGAAKFAHYAKKSYGVEITQAAAEEAILEWKDLYSGYVDWQQKQVRNATKSFQVRTPNGKLRCLPSDNTYGTSMNTPVQGGAAEVMLCALVRVHDAIKEVSSIQIVNCVHDEILLESEIPLAQKAKGILEESMISGFLDIFPYGCTNKLVECKLGNSWAEAK